MAIIRVLQVFTIMDIGGSESMIMNYYRRMDTSKIQFDFLVHRDKKGDYDDEILSLGGTIFKLPAINPLFPNSYYQKLRAFFKVHKDYRIIHAHLNTFSSFPLKIAKEFNINCRIAHAHIAMKDLTLKFLFSNNTLKVSHLAKYFIKMHLKKQIHKYPTYLFSCGQEAGKWLFHEKPFEVMNNAIDSKKFLFNPSISEAYKNTFNLNNAFTIGHVGRFDRQKNHLFLLEIFQSFLKRHPNSVLFLIGEGPTKKHIIAEAKKRNIFAKIRFTGLRNDINNMLQIMDCFVFPSLYEGLPLTLIEAQASGVPILASNTISDEVKITDLIEFIPLSKLSGYWADKIHTIFKKNKIKPNMEQAIVNGGYDIVSNALKMQNFYLQKHYI